MQEKKKSKGGRPRLNNEDKRRHLVQIKINDKELAKLNGLTNRSRLSQADLIREVLFKGKVTVYTHDSSLDKYVAKLAEGLSYMERASENLQDVFRKLSDFQDVKEVGRYLHELKNAIKEYNLTQQAYYEITKEVNEIWLQG